MREHRRKARERGAPTGPEGAPARGSAWWLAVPLLLAVAAYARVLDGEFQLDDLSAVLGRPAARDLATAVRHLPGSILRGGRPVVDLTFAIDHTLGGGAPRAYHLTNLAIHLGAVVLASGLYLLALLLLLEAERPGRGWRSLAAWVGGLVAFVLAVGTKPIAVTLPLTWLLLAWMVPDPEGRKALATWRRRLSLAAPFLLLDVVGALAVLRGLAGQASAGFDMPGLSPWSYFLSQWKAVATYLRLLAWPAGQNLEWDLPLARSLSDPGVVASGLVLVGLVAGAGALFSWSRRRWNAGGAAGRVAAFGLSWFFLVLAPTSSVVPLDDLLMEHRVYLASLGIFLALGVGGERLLARLRWRPAVAAALVTGLWCTLAIALHRRNAAWETRLSMSLDAAAKSPRKARVHVNLGHALGERGDQEAAVREYRQALSLVGDSPRNEALILRNLSAALASQGRWDEAEDALRRGVERDPANADVLVNLAIALGRRGDLDGAESWARRALALRPDDGQALHLLGTVLLRRGDAAGALGPLEQAARADPEDGLRRFNLGVAQERLGRLAEACASWRDVARLRAAAQVREEAQRRIAAAGCPPRLPR